MKKALINARILTDERPAFDGYVVYDEDGILGCGCGAPIISDCEMTDVYGAYVAPGFIDLHVHGGGGSDFLDDDPEDFIKAAEAHAKCGTTSLYPTVMAADFDSIVTAQKVFSEANNRKHNGANMPGLHLEGPYFNPKKAGAQDPRFIRDPKPEEYEKLLDLCPDIRRWSAAPELPGALEFGRALASRGVIAAVAHSAAMYAEGKAAFENGYTLSTHTYNAMRGLERIGIKRYAGLVEAVLDIDDFDAEMIADGLHVPPEIIHMAWKIKGTEHLALITDGTRGSASDLVEFRLGSRVDGVPVIVRDGIANLNDFSAYAGSVATTDRLLRVAVNDARIPIESAAAMLSKTPARIMGLNKKGRLAGGYDADMVVFDENITVTRTIIGGRTVYEA